MCEVVVSDAFGALWAVELADRIRAECRELGRLAS